MKTPLILLAAALYAFGIAGMSRPAHAQTLPCGTRTEITATLLDRYESPIAMALESRGGLIELFASASGTWTLLASGPDGNACVIASGTNLVTAELPAAGIEG